MKTTEEVGLVHFDAAKRELALASGIDEVKQIRDKAEALRRYIRQQGASLEMQNQCAEIKIRAERRAGEMLRDNPAISPGQPSRAKKELFHDGTILLSDLGIDRKQSHRWQQVAAVPEEVLEKHIVETKQKGGELTSSGVRKLAANLQRKKREEEKEIEMAIGLEIGANSKDQLSERLTLLRASIEEMAANAEENSVDVIITDPPYPEGFLDCFNHLSQYASVVLKPGGSLLVMTGQFYLPIVISSLSRRMKYHWIIAYLTPGGQSPQIWPRRVNSFWKPVLWLTKGEYGGRDWHGDVISSDANDNDKRYHRWGQSESGITRLVEGFSKPNDLVSDPFVGGGTTAVVAIRLGRRFVGSDIDQATLDVCRERVINCYERSQ